MANDCIRTGRNSSAKCIVVSFISSLRLLTIDNSHCEGNIWLLYNIKIMMMFTWVNWRSHEWSTWCIGGTLSNNLLSPLGVQYVQNLTAQLKMLWTCCWHVINRPTCHENPKRTCWLPTCRVLYLWVKCQNLLCSLIVNEKLIHSWKTFLYFQSMTVS